MVNGIFSCVKLVVSFFPQFALKEKYKKKIFFLKYFLQKISYIFSAKAIKNFIRLIFANNE